MRPRRSNIGKSRAKRQKRTLIFPDWCLFHRWQAWGSASRYNGAPAHTGREPFSPYQSGNLPPTAITITAVRLAALMTTDPAAKPTVAITIGPPIRATAKATTTIVHWVRVRATDLRRSEYLGFPST